VELGELFGAEKLRPLLSDRDHPRKPCSIVGAYRRPNGECLKKQTENAGIDGLVRGFSSCEQDFIMKVTDANQVDDIVHQTMQLGSTTVICLKFMGR
jgi:hypothetical protein